jgi:exoribonuclease R
VHRLLAAAIDI